MNKSGDHIQCAALPPFYRYLHNGTADLSQAVARLALNWRRKEVFSVLHDMTPGEKRAGVRN